MKKKIIVSFSLAGVLVGWLHPDWRLSAAGYPSSTQQSDAVTATQTTAANQQSILTTRIISNMISSRISSNIFSPNYSANIPKGASGDSKSWKPDSLWSNASWSGLTSNGSSSYGSYNANIYQYILGIDKQVGNFYFGTAVNYAGVTNHLQPLGSAGFNGSSQTGGITPYVAYTFTKNFFISGMGGYNYTATSNNGMAPDSEINTTMTEFDLNGIKVIDNWFIKAKTGARYLYTSVSVNGSGSSIPTSSNNLWTYLLDLEGGYSFKNGLRVYNGILYENLSPSNSIQNGTNYSIGSIGNNIFYYSAGADYLMNKKFTLGGKVQTDLNNNVSNLTTVTLNLRYLFD